MKHVFILMAFVSNFFLMVGQQNGSIENVISNTHDKHIQIIPFIPPIDSSKYATIYVYRRGKSLASLASFDIHFDGGIVCKMKNKSKFEFRVFTEGPLYYWMGYKYLGGKDDEQYKSKNIQRLDVKFGESYYVECVYIVSGGIMGVPVIRNVLNEEGNKNYVKISKINEYKYIPELEASCKTLKYSIEEKEILGKDILGTSAPNVLIIDNDSINLPIIGSDVNSGRFFVDQNISYYEISDFYSKFKFEGIAKQGVWKLIEYSSSFCIVIKTGK